MVIVNGVAHEVEVDQVRAGAFSRSGVMIGTCLCGVEVGMPYGPGEADCVHMQVSLATAWHIKNGE
jgi:hypothetical protein